MAVFNAPGFDDFDAAIGMANRKFKVVNAVAMFDLIEKPFGVVGQRGRSVNVIEHVLKKAGVSCHVLSLLVDGVWQWFYRITLPDCLLSSF
jgi:hypothetical protein